MGAATQFSCADLAAMVQTAGKLAITGRKYQPRGNRTRMAGLFHERRWRVRAVPPA